MTDSATDKTSCLSHVRVLDLSRVFAGPWTTQALADMGADVIKVEHPTRGDDARRLGPPFLRDDAGNETTDAAFFLSANRNKRSITLDLSKPQGQAIVKELAKSSDILVENYKVGDLRRYGLDYESLAAINPRLVYCSITGFGQTGPRRSQPGYDSIFQGMGGMMALTGSADDEPGGGPQKVGFIVADLITGMYATIAIMAALQHRDQVSGEGQYIDLALLDSQVAALSHAGVSYLVSGTKSDRMGTKSPTVSPSQMFKCKDARIMLVIGNDPQFKRLAEVLAVPALASDPRFSVNHARVTHRAALNEIIEPIFLTKNRSYWLEKLDAQRVPSGPINELPEVFAEPQVIAREMVVEMAHAKRKSIKMLANPIKFSKTPVQYRIAPPTLGQHSGEILSEVLHYSPAQIEELRANGVV